VGNEDKIHAVDVAAHMHTALVCTPNISRENVLIMASREYAFSPAFEAIDVSISMVGAVNAIDVGY